MDEFPFFGSNDNPAPVSDDLLDTATQLESIDADDYPPNAQAPLDDFMPRPRRGSVLFLAFSDAAGDEVSLYFSFFLSSGVYFVRIKL